MSHNDQSEVSPERLQRAGRLLAECARAVGEEGTRYVLEQLGLETYVDATDGKFQLRGLTPLQIVALAAALHAYRETL